MTKPTRVLVVIAVAIALFSATPATQVDAEGPVDLPPAPPIAKPVHPRLDSQLNRMVEQVELASPDAIALQAPMYLGSSVAVTVRLSAGADAIAAFIEEGGGIAANIGVDYVEAYVPVTLLVAVSELENVLWVETIVPPQPTVVSQGAAAHGAPAWNARGFTGAGVKVGIIDAGFQGFGAMMGAELPSTVVARCYTAIGAFTTNIADCENGEVHGAAVAEAVIDIAPDAALYVANAESAGDLQSIASWMVSQGVQVINMSLAWAWDGHGDGSSPFSDSPLKTVDSTVAGGALWVNSAGNSANSSWFGAYSNTDADSGDSWIEFSPDNEANAVFLTAGQRLIALARWDDNWGNASRDFDLFLFSGPNVVAVGGDEQSGGSGQYPFDAIVYTAPTTGTYLLAIFHFGGAIPAWLQLNAFSGQTLGVATVATSIVNPAESANPGMLAVGAANWATTNTIEPFSSQGPTIDGRIKPDLVGVDGADSVTYGPSGFFGTSQASPHVAGLAALVFEQFPSFTPVQAADYLKNNALPRGASPNNTWGSGLAQLPALKPGAPAGVSAAGGDGEATVSWSARRTAGAPSPNTA